MDKTLFQSRSSLILSGRLPYVKDVGYCVLNVADRPQSTGQSRTRGLG
jgi:hypothetical protein